VERRSLPNLTLDVYQSDVFEELAHLVGGQGLGEAVGDHIIGGRVHNPDLLPLYFLPQPVVLDMNMSEQPKHTTRRTISSSLTVVSRHSWKVAAPISARYLDSISASGRSRSWSEFRPTVVSLPL